MSPAVPGVAPAWPTKAMRPIRPAAAANCSRRVAGHDDEHGEDRTARAEPDRADQAEAGIGEHRPDAAVQADGDDRRAIDVGGQPHQPGGFGQDRDRERDPDREVAAAAQLRKTGHRSGRRRAEAGSATSTMNATVPEASTVARDMDGAEQDKRVDH